MLCAPPGPSNEGHSQVSPSFFPSFTFLIKRTVANFLFLRSRVSWVREGGESPRSVAFGSEPWSIAGNSLERSSAGALAHRSKQIEKRYSRCALTVARGAQVR